MSAPEKLQQQKKILEHVCDLAREAEAHWLFEYLFDTEDRSGCNGVWAVFLTSEGTEDAKARIDVLNRGGLPVGISPHNETTEQKLNERLYNEESVLKSDTFPICERAMMGNKSYVPIQIVIQHQTKSAVLVRCNNLTKETWIPWSLVEDNGEEFKNKYKGTMYVESWFVEKNGIEPLL